MKRAILIIFFYPLFATAQIQKDTNISLVDTLTNALKNSPNENTRTYKGKAIMQVFGNFDYNATNNAQKNYSFWFGRAHLGYEYQFSKQFSGRIVIDAGRPTSVGDISVSDATGENLTVKNNSKEGSYYTMTLKFASLEWKPDDNVRIQVGGILQNHYITQEKFWGYRYLAETFQDRYYKTPSSDLGIIGYFRLNEKIGMDITLTNGEGFRFDQDQYGDVKVATGVDLYLIDGLQTRIYYDYSNSRNPLRPAKQQLISAFAGYCDNTKYRIGAEYNYKFNHLYINNHDLFGVSIYGSYSLLKNVELFFRFDRLEANTISNETNNWYYNNTGKAYIAGIHTNPIKGVNVSLNYQGWKPDNTLMAFQNHLLLSFEFKL